MAMSKFEIGNEIEGYCGKCKTDTFHIITAVADDQIEKVMCKVCMSYHKFKKPMNASEEPQVKKAKAPAKPATPAKPRARRDKWTRILEDIDSAAAIEYKMEKEYELATAIHHQIFGLGVVKNIIDSRKIGVLFHGGEKILVQNLQQ